MYEPSSRLPSYLNLHSHAPCIMISWWMLPGSVGKGRSRRLAYVCGRAYSIELVKRTSATWCIRYGRRQRSAAPGYVGPAHPRFAGTLWALLASSPCAPWGTDHADGCAPQVPKQQFLFLYLHILPTCTHASCLQPIEHVVQPPSVLRNEGFPWERLESSRTRGSWAVTHGNTMIGDSRCSLISTRTARKQWPTPCCCCGD